MKWVNISEGVDYTTEEFGEGEEGFYLEHFTPLNEPDYSSFKSSTVTGTPLTEVHKTETEEYSYIMTAYYNNDYECKEIVTMRFKL